MKKTSKDWYEEVPEKYKLVILDPDGWDRKNYEYSFNEELITKDEFKMRLSSSTIQCDLSFFAEDMNEEPNTDDDIHIAVCDRYRRLNWVQKLLRKTGLFYKNVSNGYMFSYRLGEDGEVYFVEL